MSAVCVCQKSNCEVCGAYRPSRAVPETETRATLPVGGVGGVMTRVGTPTARGSFGTKLIDIEALLVMGFGLGGDRNAVYDRVRSWARQEASSTAGNQLDRPAIGQDRG